MDHFLYVWKQFLQEDDYDYLIQYVENTKNNVPNYGVINLSGPGQDSLKNDCKRYMKLNTCSSIYTTPYPVFLPDKLDNQIVRIILIKPIE